MCYCPSCVTSGIFSQNLSHSFLSLLQLFQCICVIADVSLLVKNAMLHFHPCSMLLSFEGAQDYSEVSPYNIHYSPNSVNPPITMVDFPQIPTVNASEGSDSVVAASSEVAGTVDCDDSPPPCLPLPPVIPSPSNEADKISSSQRTIHTIHEHVLKDGKEV